MRLQRALHCEGAAAQKRMTRRVGASRPRHGRDLGSVKEEEASVEKRHCTGVSVNTVLLGDVGLEDAVDYVKETEGEAVAEFE